MHCGILQKARRREDRAGDDLELDGRQQSIEKSGMVLLNKLRGLRVASDVSKKLNGRHR